MSARTVESLHPATWASIQMQNEDESTGHGTQWTCGCSLVQGKVWLCQYHDGYDDGAWALDGDDSTDE